MGLNFTSSSLHTVLTAVNTGMIQSGFCSPAAHRPESRVPSPDSIGYGIRDRPFKMTHSTNKI